METLTKAEEKVMHLLWAQEKAFVKDIIEQMEEPKPNYNTVSTIIRILEKKGFVDHESYGKTHQYFPIVAKAAYKKYLVKKMVKDYFENSYENVDSFLIKDEKLSDKEIDELRKMIDNE
jgi:predicted transcriptional regulator